MNKQYLAGLICKYEAGLISDKEKAKLMKWVNTNEANRQTFKDVMANIKSLRENPRFEDKAKYWQKLCKLIPSLRSISSVVMIWRPMVAAAIVLLIGLVACIFITGNEPARPGLATQVVYHKVATGKGQQQQLLLPDSSRVWLNAGSSVTFPWRFTGAEYSVELTGEAYFEIERKKGSRLFVVTIKSGTKTIEVKTSAARFNIMAYRDEPESKATLLEGTVEVYRPGTDTLGAGGRPVLLNAGEQAALRYNRLPVNDSAAGIIIPDADVGQAVAWKEGYFAFDSADINTIMRDLARWYNVEVIYGDNISKKLYSGWLLREYSLTDILNALTMVGLNTWLCSGDSDTPQKLLVFD